MFLGVDLSITRTATHVRCLGALYAFTLRWAEDELKKQAATRMAAMDIGRHIQSFV